MTASSSVAEADCPGDTSLPHAGLARRHPRGPARDLRVERRTIDAIPRETWDALAAISPWATPFSAWAFQRAWWDAYGANARDETLVVLDPATGGAAVAILPLMLRHAVEASDAATHTRLRHGDEPALTSVPAAAATLFMGASYHADYATVLGAPAHLRDACAAIATHLAGPAAPRWDALDLRRLRCGDPAADELAAAFGALEIPEGWTLNLEREDVCPVATIPEGADFDGFLATLDKKERHEIRRKIRRAEAVGPVVLSRSEDPLAELDAFIDLHQARWGAEGLFPPTPGGDQSRRFVRRLFELFGADGPVKLTFLAVGGRRIASGIHFETGDAFLYYNAGVDPQASDLSPGVILVARYVQLAIEAGVRRMDFLRGAEPYKYAWGAVDEPVRRLLVRRTAGSAVG